MHDELESLIIRIGARQHGVVARRQLEQAGISGDRIRYRVQRGRLRPLHRGVYRTGAAATQLEPEMAAVLASGEGAVLSHRSAAVLWNLVIPAAAAPIDATIGCGRGPTGNGIRCHRVRDLPADESSQAYGIPITTPARTVLDLASSVDVDELERIVARAFRSLVVTREEVERLVLRHRSRSGIRKLRRVLARADEPMLTRSEAEKLALALFRKAALEPPRSNVLVEGYEVDFLWPAQRVVAEIDGFAFHSSPIDFERDRLRDAALAAAGYRVIRMTWRQLTRGREAVIARLAATLAQ